MIAPMPPDRSDDVEFRFIDAPPQRPRRRRRWVVAAAATILTAGALAAGASALTGGDNPAAPAAKPTQSHHRFGYHHGCHRGDRSHHAPDASTFKY
jgi:hypothetical protein